VNVFKSEIYVTKKKKMYTFFLGIRGPAISTHGSVIQGMQVLLLSIWFSYSGVCKTEYGSDYGCIINNGNI